MNILIALAMMISFSMAGVNEVAQKIAASYQNLQKGVPAGSYSTTMLVTYDFSITDTNTGTIPVLLTSPQTMKVPSVIKGCEVQSSLSCETAEYLDRWMKAVKPEGEGRFSLQFAFFGNGIAKETTLFIEKSEME